MHLEGITHHSSILPSFTKLGGVLRIFSRVSHFALCLSPLPIQNSCICSLLSGWDTTTGRLLASKIGNAASSVFPKDTTTHYHIGSRTKVS